MYHLRRHGRMLLGGKTGAEVEGHDWEYLLGSLTMIVALVWAAIVVLTQVSLRSRRAAL